MRVGNMATVTIDNIIKGNLVMHDHSASDLGAILDTRYLKVASNLSDLATVATARTNLGLVAGGTGDIWVEKAGDTMTGPLDISAVGGSGQTMLKIASAATSGTGLSFVSGSYTTQIFNISATHTPSGTTPQALRFVCTLSPTSDSTNYYGLNLNNRMANSAFNITTLRMISTQLFSDAGASGTITNLYHHGIGDVSYNTGTTVVENNYGIYINELAAGTVSNYAIYTQGGLHRFGDSTEISKLNGEAILWIYRRDTSVTAADPIGGIYFQTNDAQTGTISSAYIKAISTDTHTSLKFGSSMDFYSTPTNSIVTAKDMSLNGGVTIYTTLTMTDAINMVLGSTTGTKFGTATTEKLSFHNATPTVQRAGAAQAQVATTGSTTTTPYGYTTSAQADGIVALLNEIRAVLVEKGLMKGSS